MSMMDANMPLEFQYCRTTDVNSWPDCIDRHVDWAALFGDDWGGEYGADPDGDGNEDIKGGHEAWITPRMAARLFTSACNIADLMIDQGCASRGGFFDPPLPRVARPFYQYSDEWRRDFLECHKRIAMRLANGTPPRPNCTGEEMALHNIINLARDEDMMSRYDYYFAELPKRPNDDNFSLLLDNAFQDHDVLMLFENGDVGYDVPGWGGSDPEGSVGKALTQFLCDIEGAKVASVVNLHPSTWFHAFQWADMDDHLGLPVLHSHAA